MSKRIIKLTESQLKDIVAKVISEQGLAGDPNTGQASGGQIYNVTNSNTKSETPTQGSAMNPKGGVNQFGAQKSLNIACVLKSPEQKKQITGKNGDIVVFFNNGRFADVKGNKGNYECNGQQANTVNLMYDSNPKAIKYFAIGQSTPNKPKTSWVANGDKFPLKFGQYGNLIKQLQVSVGAYDGQKPADGYFGPKTEAVLKLKYPKYDRTIGVDQSTFNFLMGSGNVNPLQNSPKLNTDVNRIKTT